MKNTKCRIFKYIIMFVMLVCVNLINGSSENFAQPFEYNVGDTFVVDGYWFKIVNKEARQAVAQTRILNPEHWSTANDMALGFATRNPSYISLSGLPTRDDYLNTTFRERIGNLTYEGEWTSTPGTTPGYYCVGTRDGAGANGVDGSFASAYFRPVLYLKSGLSISGPGGTLSVPDTTSPSATITANPTADPTNAISITYTFTFSEPVTGFDITDITVTNGTKGTFTATSTSVYTLVVTNTGSVTQTVSIAAGRCTDLAGNNNTTASKSVTIDRTAPTAAITYSPSGPYKSGTVVTITATFSEVMKDSPVPRITINGANTLAATNMTKVSTTSYRYIHTVGVGNGTATVSLSTGEDTVGNVVTAAPTGGATFTVDNTAPAAPTFSATPTTQTNGNVIVTINYPGDASTKEYKIGSGGTWTAYTTAVTVTSNNTIYAIGTDVAGNTSTEATCTVGNIDKIAPSITLTASTTATTNTNVMVTANITDNVSVSVKKWSAGSQTASYFGTGGTTLGASFTASANGTYTAYAKDTAGNETVQTITISNIDTEAPPAPQFTTTPSITIPTKNDIVVTIHSWGDATKREYKKVLPGGVIETDWTDYIIDIVIDKNCTIYAKGTDTAGNVSGESALSITKIDKLPPTITLTPSIIIPTNQNVIVTANITDNISGVDVKKWASGNQPVDYFITNGTALDTSFEVSENRTYTAYAKDIVGNEAVQTILIENIDKDAPGVPEFILSTTLPIDKVTVTIEFPNGSHTKEYKIGDGSWGSYTEPLVIDKNVTVYAKCADILGNTTGETSLNIRNIEVNGSVEGIELDDRKYFRYYLGLGRNNITQCMLVAGNENGKVKRDFGRDDVIDINTNKFKDGIFYIDIHGKIKMY